ncbi:MFS transporter [Psychrobacillus sp. INOP01]|uniref:MFS transporter n=1 Tax=Psychrobacillus sp. INOP01 TaxID=2829187 RepID=UPI001BA57993|nr:MFS transporter [Psychrobacillus sp. INOP01]QUG41164.1 MFS transporter [Psychrobacillus sp. INOP01]
MKSNKNFILLVTGQSIANLGDIFYIVSVISILYNLTSSAAISAMVPFTITSAMFLSNLLTPLLLGKYRLKTLLVWTQGFKTVLLVGLLIFVHVFLNGSNYWVIYFIIGLIGFFDGCANPIMRTFLPYYVEDRLLVKANGMLETLTQMIQIVAWLFGGLLLLAVSPIQMIMIVSFLFLISSITLSLLQHVKYEEEKEKEATFWSKLTEGWRSIGATPVLRKIMQMDMIETIAGTVWIAAIVYVYVEEVLAAGEQWWGFINGSFFIGFLVGSLYCLKFPDLVEKYKFYFICFGALISGMLTIVFGSISHPVIALFLSASIGLFSQVKNIPQETVIQRSVAIEKLVTVYTSLGTVGSGIFGVSALVIGITTDLIGVRAVFVISGLLLVIVTLIVFLNKKLFV